MADKIIAKRRIEVIDIIKCLAIFAVVLGHTATNEELNGNPPLVYKVIYSFHMPLFFFLTGLSLSLKPLKSWHEWILFLRKNILALIFPYIVWALIFCNFNFQNVAYVLYGSWQALGKTGTLTSLWYLPSLFMARIYVQLIVNQFSHFKISENKMIYIIPCAFFLIIGAVLPKISIGYPLCADNAFIGAAFILLGIAVKKNLIIFSAQKVKVFIGALFVSTGLYALIVLILGNSFEMNLMCKSSYGMLLPALFGGIVFVVLAVFIKRLADEWIPNFNTKLLVYIGQHTMGIFILHKPMMQQIIIPGLRSVLGELCSEGIIRFLGASIAFIVAILLCRVIEHYVPEMLGIFRKDLIIGKKTY